MRRQLRPSAWLALFAAFLAFSCGDPAAAATNGLLAFHFPPKHLARLGLEVTGSARPLDHAALRDVALDPPVFAFELTDGRATGGLSLRAEDAATGRALPPVLFYDVGVETDADGAVRLRTADPLLPFPLDLRTAGSGTERRGDVLVSAAWADRLGHPELAGQWIGTVEIRLAARVPAGSVPAPDELPAATGVLDAELGELYALTAIGRDDPYPTGSSALAAATTSCNPGTVPIPWQLETFQGPLLETHPFIGQAVFRLDAGGRLEMIGKSWIKHGFFALGQNDCSYGCTAGPTTALQPGCADTYAAGHNGSRLYLAPRDEVNPYTGSWTALGSFFDAVPVDGFRNYTGGESSEVAHRMEVWDADLGNAGARYFYEGAYYVKNDIDPTNNIGWKECTVAWSGALWTFTDVIAFPAWPQRDNDGPLVSTWGDLSVEVPAAADDGTVWLAVKVDSLGGGQWHYEYAVYNRTSARGLRSFSVPVGFAQITNVGFHDVDKDGSNDWTATVGPGMVEWATGDFVTDPTAPALTYQSMFNFRFDANVPPVSSQVQADLFRPGIGTTLTGTLLAPFAGAVSAPPTPGRADLALRSVEPNPFRGGASVSFSLDRERAARVAVHDVSGRLVRVLWDGAAPGGASSVGWDGRDASGGRAAAGVYFFRLTSGSDIRTIKGTLLR